MDNRGYFIVDGSHLFSGIHEIWRIKPQYQNHQLNIGKLAEALIRTWSLYIGSAVRVVYYFKQNDERIKRMLIVPDASKPGEKDHWQIKECGESLDAVPQVELDKLSPEYRDHFARAEKGLDIKIACDALLLVANDRASNVVFLANDRDYIPLFEAIQNQGGNVYLTSLHSDQHIQQKLAKLADKYLTLGHELDNIFGITAQLSQPIALQQTTPIVESRTVTPKQITE